MACLKESVVLDLVDGRLAPAERAEAQGHVDSCPQCCELVAQTARALLSTRTREPGAQPDPPSPLSRGAQVGRYLVVGPVGAGGMGVVYAAYDPKLDRKIALKLLRPEASRSDAATQERLLREGQALARLSHPNVVAVFDVGTFDDQVFVAMEFVEGATLAQWLRETPRLWPQVLEVLVGAGRGLATAHAAGLIHRDFKPENVLVGRDGRARVTDFGLARPVLAAPSPAIAGAATGPVSNLTETRALVGTPAYMAPEQLRGEKVDARADVYAFCLTLFEALYGERPFAGTTLESLLAARASGAVRQVNAAGVPARLRTLIARGLEPDPAQRYPSMDELLELLVQDPRARRKRRLATAGVALALAAAVGLPVLWRAGQGDPRARLCGGAAQKAGEAWGAQQREAARTAFLATRAPYAEQALASATGSLDAYAAAWTAMRTEACEATRVRGEQSEQMLDLRMACLDRRWRGLNALSSLFASADPRTVEHAVSAAAALEPISTCAAGPALTDRASLPADPAARRTIAEVDDALARAQALRDSGRWPDGLHAARPLLPKARETRYRPLEARAALLLGDLLDRTGELAEAEATLSEAVWAAEAGREDVSGAQAASRLTSLVGYRRSRPDEGQRWARHAAALLERAGGDDETQARLDADLGMLLRGTGKYEAALERFQAARARREKLPADPERANALFGVALALRDVGRQDEARQTLETALSEQTALLGPAHPLVAKTLSELSGAEIRVSRLESAETHLKQALAILEATLGPDHIEVGYTVNRLGNLALARGDFAEALARFERTMAIGRVTLQADHPEIAMAHNNLALALTGLGRYAESSEHVRASKAGLEARAHPFLAEVYATSGELEAAQGHCPEAVAEFGRAIAIGERELGKDHPDVAANLTALGRTELDCARQAKAREHLERAAAIDPRHRPPPDLAETQWQLARALGAKEPRARELAVAARAFFAGRGKSGASRVQAIDRFVAQ
ncbi:MAG TPA: serine/threonine-protein kinase [Myxococcales bacterium]|jgi:tetratricopeptide (TPR) repeat protein/predicted Ser/Thr protein kinase